MTMSEVITRRQSGHLNKIKWAESDDPWELFAFLLVCGQGQRIGCNFFACRKDKTRQLSDPDELQFLWQKAQKQ